MLAESSKNNKVCESFGELQNSLSLSHARNKQTKNIIEDRVALCLDIQKGYRPVIKRSTVHELEAARNYKSFRANQKIQGYFRLHPKRLLKQIETTYVFQVHPSAQITGSLLKNIRTSK